MRTLWRRRSQQLALAASIALLAVGCGDGGGSDDEPFTMRFAAVDGTREVGCGDTIAGLGSSGSSVEISDLRFYVSNLRFSLADGDVVTASLDPTAFQYTDDEGSVALVDLTGTAAGACSGQGITFPEGTARTNQVITGSVGGKGIAGVSFDVAIPQALMKKVIANHTAEDAPSPFAEMHWSWAYAYRFFVMNAVVRDGAETGEGYLHVGSTDCGGDGTKALTDRDSCGNLNAAHVSLSGFDPSTETVALDVRALLAGLDFQVSTEDATYLGAECHSSPSQPDCPRLFANLGIDINTGTANPALNTVFHIK